jgi:5'(3')-deoxyribonucleotidase
MEKKIIEIDVDGVLLDLLNNTELKNMLKDAYPEYTEDCIRDYDFGHLREENPLAHDIIRASFSNASYIRNIPMYDGVREGFERLVEMNGLDICIHTLVTGSYDVMKARREWIEEFKGDMQIRYQIDHMHKQMFDRPFIVIEDSPINLANSNAIHKIMIAHNYNKQFSEEHPEIHVVPSFNEATKIAAQLLS